MSYTGLHKRKGLSELVTDPIRNYWPADIAAFADANISVVFHSNFVNMGKAPHVFELFDEYDSFKNDNDLKKL